MKKLFLGLSYCMFALSFRLLGMLYCYDSDEDERDRKSVSRIADVKIPVGDSLTHLLFNLLHQFWQERDGSVRNDTLFADRMRNLLTRIALDEHGADLHVRDYFGWTPLHVAASVGDYSVVWLLLSSRSYQRGLFRALTMTTKKGETPWDIAMRNKHYLVADMLARDYSLIFAPGRIRRNSF